MRCESIKTEAAAAATWVARAYGACQKRLVKNATFEALMFEPNAKFQMPPPASRELLVSAWLRARAAAADLSHSSYAAAVMLQEHPRAQSPDIHTSFQFERSPPLSPLHQPLLSRSSGGAYISLLFLRHCTPPLFAPKEKIKNAGLLLHDVTAERKNEKSLIGSRDKKLHNSGILQHCCLFF